jgi:uncharacterized protein
MIRVVFDTNTVVSAIFWPRSTARGAWTFVARRKARPCVTAAIEREYRETCLEIQARRFPERRPLPFLDWINLVALHCLPASVGKRRSRDARDDPFLECALAAQAQYIVSSDRDLLVLGKPFGIAIITPTQFIRRVGET